MRVEPVPHLVIEDFLSPDEHAALLRMVQTDTAFEAAQVTAPGEDEGAADDRHRRAQVGNADDELFDLFDDKLRALLPHARRELGVPRFEVGTIERQVTAHHDGDFFTRHTDVGDPFGEAAARRVSYVYYFNDGERSFEDGELLLYDQAIHDDGRVDVADSFQVIDPADNTIVFFASTSMHEVRPVRVTGEPRAPGNTRYTLTGWFRDQHHVRPNPPLDPPTRTELAKRYVPSFTETGFKKVATPAAVHRAMRAVYDERVAHVQPETVDEHMPTGRPDFVNIDDVSGHFQFALQSIHEEWSGLELVPTAAYGLRIYREGQTLIPHTDRITTHVISSIVHIAHETNEPWPLVIEGLDGNEHEVVLEEGEMLLYESARCPHSRPTPLDGSAYCSLFLHFRPVDWDMDEWTVVDQARADEAWELLPRSLWPHDLATAESDDAD